MGDPKRPNPQSPKVLHLIDSGGLYGAEVMLLNLVSEQVKLGLSPTILSAGVTGEGMKPLEVIANERGIPIKVWRMRKGLNLIGAWRILRYAKKQGFKILHSHGYKFNILMGIWPAQLRLPILTTLHGYINARPGSKMSYYERIDQWILRRLDKVILVNEMMVEQPFLHMIRPRTEVINNGICIPPDTDNATELPEKITDFFEKFKSIIGAVGRLSEEKGLDVLIKSFSGITNTHRETGLVIIGDGPCRKTLEKLATELGVSNSILMTGYLPMEIAGACIENMCLLAMPSRTEGLPMTLLESMVRGIPVVASAVGGIPGLLKNGEYGLLVPPDNPELLKRAIVTLLDDADLRKRLAVCSRERVEKDYSSLNMALQYNEIYRKLI